MGTYFAVGRAVSLRICYTKYLYMYNVLVEFLADLFFAIDCHTRMLLKYSLYGTLLQVVTNAPAPNYHMGSNDTQIKRT